MDIEELLEIARQIVDKQKFCFAISVTTDGEANARIVQPRKLTQDWSVDFATRKSCRKFNEIERSGKLTLAYQDDTDRAYVSLVGTVEVIDDIELKRSRWAALTPGERELAIRWNPEGPDNPDLLYIRLITDRIELWSAAGFVMPEPRGYSAALLSRVRPGGAWQYSTS